MIDVIYGGVTTTPMKEAVQKTEDGGINFGDDTNKVVEDSVSFGENNQILGLGSFGAGTENTIGEQASGSAVFGVKNEIVNGAGHVVYGESNYVENIIKDKDGRIRTFGSHCVSGKNNTVNGGGYGVLLGESNTYGCGWGNVIAGQNNIIEYTDFTNSDYNILAGIQNRLVKGASNIIGGIKNEVTCQQSVVSGSYHILEKGGNLAVFGTGHYLPNTTNTAGNLLVAGRYSKLDSSRQLFVVGNGTSDSNRDNAFEVRSNVGGGGAYAILGGKSLTTSDIDSIHTIKDKADTSYVDTEVGKLQAQFDELPTEEEILEYLDAGYVTKDFYTTLVNRVTELEQQVAELLAAKES